MSSRAVLGKAPRRRPAPWRRDDSWHASVDALFRGWDRADSAGGAIGIYASGEIVYARGFGAANLEYGIAIDTTTSFHVASLSKQFTAAAILLLVEGGQCRLDAPLGEYLPELPAFDAPVTVAQLLHHTSGIRDQWALLELSGWRYATDAISDDDVREVVGRATRLNFSPGERFAYSNTGYTLLAMIVARLSGRPFAEFLRDVIFAPLGMEQTRFRVHHGEVVGRRASGYRYDAEARAFRLFEPRFDTSGATNLQTTVDDLAKWDANFYRHTVGGPSLARRLSEPGRLSNGEVLDYAGGVIVDRYRGLSMMRHGGADVGFRAEMLRFPDERLTIVVLGNTAELPATALARRVADICLAPRLTPAVVPRREPPPETTGAEPAVYDGVYWHADGDHYMAVRGRREVRTVDVLVSGQAFTLTSTSPDVFQLFDPAEGDLVTFIFEPERLPPSVRVHFANAGRTYVYESQGPVFESERLDDYVGTYVSDEVEPHYRVLVRDRQLVVCLARHAPVPLFPSLPDVFSTAFGVIRFARDAAGRVARFTLSSTRVRNLCFERVRTSPAHPVDAAPAGAGAEAAHMDQPFRNPVDRGATT